MIFWATFLPYAMLSIGLGWVFLSRVKILKPAWIWLTNAIALVIVLSSCPMTMFIGQADRSVEPLGVLVLGLFVPVVLSMVWAGISFVLAWKRSKPDERVKTILIQMFLGPGIAIALGYLIFFGASIYHSLPSTGV